MIHQAVLQFILATVLQSSSGQTCDGTETFEKVTGVRLVGASQLQLTGGNTGRTVTALCNNRCRELSDCEAFLLDYDNSACYQLDTNLEDNRELIVSTDSRTGYFEKVCLRAPACEKAWIYERSVGYLLEGYDDRVIAGVSSRLQCEELCLLEREFSCASAEYFYSSEECRLSRDTRRSKPAAFRAATEKVDYLENQCHRERFPATCQPELHEDQDLGYADLDISVNNAVECGEQCQQTVAFNCRSYTYFPSSGSCRLSSDDTQLTSGGPGALVARPGAMFYQRGPCLELSLDCSAEAMKVTLSTEEPFTGRLYSEGGGSECQARGNARTETELVVGLDPPSLSRCGVSRQSGVLSAVVVVQHHPVIQRRGDKAVQVICYFQDTNKVVTNSYDIISDSAQSVPPSVLNGTAETPSVTLRITTDAGQDVTGTRLGEKLFLRIEMDTDSIFGIFARNLRALRGDSQESQESIQLLDERGCPTEPVIFSGLQKVEGSKSLQGSFEAFKFSETSVVRFQVSVQFCVGECRPAQCNDGALSYGRRRRREVEEVLEHDTDLVKEIFVETGSSVEELASAPVYVQGQVAGVDLVCTSWPVVVASTAGIIFLQLCLLSTCVLCLYSSNRQRDNKLSSARPSTSSSSSSSIQTLRSLRTTFRD